LVSIGVPFTVPEAAFLAVLATLAGAGPRHLAFGIAAAVGFAAGLLFGFGFGEAFNQDLAGRCV